jgi:dihydrofolate synthase/folylpolyglutamate synthase
VKLPKWPNPHYFHHINLGLDRIFELLKRLDNPHLKMPPTIHIAGTNGKGSTLAFLKNIFQEAGYKVHRYTSPHLVEFNERIEICGEKIDDNFLNEILEKCREACEIEPKIDITFFEATTACAFLAFSQIKADILLLETGMGGEYDATNVLPKVLCSLISTIALDHQEFLGATIEKIAKAKAGIIKENCPVICVDQNPQVLDLINSKALQLNAEFINSKVFFESLNFNLDAIKIPLIGSHQIENAQLAVSFVKYQSFFKISDENIKNGIEKTRWKARLEKIEDGIFAKKLQHNFQLYLDGSHNPQGGTTIAEFLENFSDYRKIVIFQMLKDKNCEEFLKIIGTKIDKLLICKIASDSRFRSPQNILEIAQNLQINSKIIENFADGFEKIQQEFSSQPTLILICGSLYFAAEFLMENQKN